jgi:hypothetical protein
VSVNTTNTTATINGKATKGTTGKGRTGPKVNGATGPEVPDLAGQVTPAAVAEKERARDTEAKTIAMLSRPLARRLRAELAAELNGTMTIRRVDLAAQVGAKANALDVAAVTAGYSSIVAGRALETANRALADLEKLRQQLAEAVETHRRKADLLYAAHDEAMVDVLERWQKVEEPVFESGDEAACLPAPTGPESDEALERYLRALTRANHWIGIHEELRAVMGLAKEHAADPARLLSELSARLERSGRMMKDAEALADETEAAARSYGFPTEEDQARELAVTALFDPNPELARRAVGARTEEPQGNA